jgi:hypothetical protein
VSRRHLGGFIAAKMFGDHDSFFIVPHSGTIKMNRRHQNRPQPAELRGCPAPRSTLRADGGL